MADIASDVLVTNEDAAASNIPAQMDQTNSKQSEIADATQTFDVCKPFQLPFCFFIFFLSFYLLMSE